MEMIADIEQACRDNDHETVRRSLDTIEAHGLKRKLFLKVLEYYEHEEARFPVGYAVLFIEWLLKCGDLHTAGRYIDRMNRLGIVKERIPELIYEHVIKPDETKYEERFNSNLSMFTGNGLLFSKHTFNFHDIKKNMVTMGDHRNYPDEFNHVLSREKTSFLLVDLTDMKIIKQILEAENLLYLVYDDLNKFSYMLMFLDLISLRQFISEKKDASENLIVFAGRDRDMLHQFFSNMMTVIPQYAVVMPEHREYQDLMKEIFEERSGKSVSYTEELKVYYQNRGRAFYRGLFKRPPGEIKILIISSRNSSLNKHISRSWYESFITLGYSVKLIAEQEPYERMSDYSIREAVCIFKPDIVLSINYTVNSIMKEEEIKNTLLWIVRYRDYNNINCGDYMYQHENMFFLPHWSKFVDALRESNIPEERINFTVEGIDLNVFTPGHGINKEYETDIVSVNNSVGNEHLKLEFYLKMIDSGVLQEIMYDLYAYMKEGALNDHFVAEDEFLTILSGKCHEKGLNVNNSGRQFFIWFYLGITDSLFRRRVMEWIVDSGITKEIKVWGGSWSNVEKFKEYHMGVAHHGRQLCEIYRSSRISLCDSWEWNTHERNFEVMASGGFPLIRHIAAEGDRRKYVITSYFREDEEVVLFYGRDDLLNKIQYYLDNPGERLRIAERGRNAVIRDFSNLAVTERTMGFIKNYYLPVKRKNKRSKGQVK